MSIFFTQDQRFLEFASRKPGARGRGVKGQVSANPEFPANKTEEEALARESRRALEERYAELVLTDPAEAERLALQDMDGEEVEEDDGDGEA